MKTKKVSSKRLWKGNGPRSSVKDPKKETNLYSKSRVSSKPTLFQLGGHMALGGFFALVGGGTAIDVHN